MNFRSKQVALVILGLTALTCSRAMFFFFNDPEGPNLLVVVVGAAIIYFLSWATYKIILKFFSLAPCTWPKNVLLVILVQVIITAILYFCLS